MKRIAPDPCSNEVQFTNGCEIKATVGALLHLETSAVSMAGSTVGNIRQVF